MTAALALLTSIHRSKSSSQAVSVANGKRQAQSCGAGMHTFPKSAARYQSAVASSPITP
jgi:hypothetical protein